VSQFGEFSCRFSVAFVIHQAKEILLSSTDAELDIAHVPQLI
jgi:hypothetical protein